MSLLSGAWSPELLWYLRGGERCFSELQQDLRGVSAKVLTNRLRKLEREGVLLRCPKATSPPTVWYALTPVGQELAGALGVMVEIAHRAKHHRASL
ncbi:MAG: helix-turn-helix transcriptional regulator [Acidobacteria bacterium]|nr:helix-turn-helix transcriptional regulator [Acidobacteriota bacterium]